VCVQVEGGDAVLESSAVQMCARKVAAVAGDARTALDVCRRAVEAVESDTRRQLKLGTLIVPCFLFYTDTSSTVSKLAFLCYFLHCPVCQFQWLTACILQTLALAARCQFGSRGRLF